MVYCMIYCNQLTWLAYRTSEKTPLLPGAVPSAIRPPEVVIHELNGNEVSSMWSKEAEIWAVGCTVGTLRMLFN